MKTSDFLKTAKQLRAEFNIDNQNANRVAIEGLFTAKSGLDEFIDHVDLLLRAGSKEDEELPDRWTEENDTSFNLESLTALLNEYRKALDIYLSNDGSALDGETIYFFMRLGSWMNVKHYLND
jgi:hypothetical protein